MAKRISIRDLAQIAGVSRTTVSLALRGSHKVSEATRNRIRALAEKYDYRSHPAVNALMQQVARGQRIHDEEIIAFVRCGKDPDERALGPLEILEGARHEAHRLGYRVEIFWAGPGGEHAERLARVLYHRGIRGVIWAPMPYPHPPVQFPWEHFVPVACTPSTYIAQMPTVQIHHPKGMALVLEEIARRGAQRIGFIENFIHDKRIDFGWLLGVDLYKHRGGRAHVSTLLLKKPKDQERVRSWLKRENVEVVVAPPDLLMKVQPYLGGLPWVSLDVPSSELGQTAGLFQNMVHVGKNAVNSLSKRLSTGTLGLPSYSYSVLVQASFVDGRSLDALKAPE